MTKKVNLMEGEFIKEQCDNLASSGLRTLVITKKEIPQKEFDLWFERYEDANAAMDNRDEKV